MPNTTLARIPLFEGLSDDAMEDVVRRMVARDFAAKDVICREGEPGRSLFIILSGLAQVSVRDRQTGDDRILTRFRRGDVAGEMALITGEPRSATLIAVIPTRALELEQVEFAALLAAHPTVVMNLNRILSRRLARTNVRQAHGGRRGEAIALLLSERARPLLARIVEATSAASPHGVTGVPIVADGGTSDGSSIEGALAMLDDLLADYGTVILAADVDHEKLSLLLEHMDRVIAVAPASFLEGLGRPGSGASSLEANDSLDVLAISAGSSSGAQVLSGRILRQLNLHDPVSAGRDIAWLGRHLARTKLGLALGAGGAKGYAHVGVLHVLQQAGYTVDYVAGSSIGAMVGAWLAMGMDAAEIERTMRNAFSPDNVEAMFKISMAGMSTGLDVHTRVCRETTRDCAFSDLRIPLVAMAVDLTTREPAPIADGPVWEGLLASTALAGMFPPVERGDQRLVDGLALVPVPTRSVTELGADVTLSVNIMSRETLDAWPGQVPPEPAPARRGSRMLDTLLEVMDLAQLDSSIRHAALADVVLTPRFGPASWRDFHLADLFLAAGRQVAEEQLASLHSLARPQISIPYKGAVHGAAVHV